MENLVWCTGMWRLIAVSPKDTVSVADPGFSPGGGRQTPKIAIIFHIFAKNCTKMKEFGPPGGARVPSAPLGSANASRLKLFLGGMLLP